MIVEFYTAVLKIAGFWAWWIPSLRSIFFGRAGLHKWQEKPELERKYPWVRCQHTFLAPDGDINIGFNLLISLVGYYAAEAGQDPPQPERKANPIILVGFDFYFPYFNFKIKNTHLQVY